jgi:hypothetical protein
MSDVIAGDFISALADHPSLGSFVYEQKSGGENKATPGGLMTNSDDGGVTNAGNLIRVLNRKRGKYSLEVALTSGCEKYTTDTSRDKDLTIYTLTKADGTTVKIKGCPCGDLQFDNQNGTFTLNIEGQEIKYT